VKVENHINNSPVDKTCPEINREPVHQNKNINEQDLNSKNDMIQKIELTSLKYNAEKPLNDKAEIENINNAPDLTSNFNSNFNSNNNRIIKFGIQNKKSSKFKFDCECCSDENQVLAFKIFGILFHLGLIGLDIAIIIIIVKMTNIIKNNENTYFREVYSSWDSNLIGSITNTCDNSKSLLQEYWEGTNAGCVCSSYVSLTGCPGGKNGPTCGNKVTPLEPMPYLTWKGINLCKGSNNEWDNLKYFDLNIEKSANDCPNGTRSCGRIDDFGNHLCLENSKICPVISIKFYSSEYFNLFTKNQTKSDDNFLKSSQGVIVSSRNEKSIMNVNEIQIPVDFAISEGFPCKNPYNKNRPYVYELDMFKDRNICYKYSNVEDNKINNSITLLYDTNFTKIDDTTVTSLYQENNILPGIIRLPFYPINTLARNISLYSKGYNGINIKCFKEIKDKKIIIDNNKKDFDKLYELSKYNFIGLQICYIFIIIGSVLNFINLILISYIIDKELKFPLLCVFIYGGVLLLYLVPSILLIIFLNNINGLMNFSNLNSDSIFSRTDCFDNFTLNLFLNIVSNIDWVRNAITLLYIFISIGIAVTIFYFFVFIIFREKI